MKTKKSKKGLNASVLLGLFILAMIVFIPVSAFAAGADDGSAGTDGSEQALDSANADEVNTVGSTADPDGSGTLSTFLDEAPASTPGSSPDSIEPVAPTATDSGSADTTEMVEITDSPAGNDNPAAAQSEATSDNGIADTSTGPVQNEGNSYFATITPDGLVDGEDTGSRRTFTVTFTELSFVTTLGSARVEIPSEFTPGFFLSISDAPACKNWDGELDGIFVYLWALDAASYLVGGESVSATFTATTPVTGNHRGIYTFETAAWTDAAPEFDGVGTTVNQMATGYRHPTVIVGKGIDDALELAAIGDLPKDLDDYYVQTADIDLSEFANWTPIGSSATPFTGGFSGNIFEIRNLAIYQPGVSDVGLFGRTSGTTIENVTLINANVVGGSSTGALIGHSVDSQIRNVDVSGTVTARGARVHAVGGLIGNFVGGTITDSSSNAGVTATGDEVHDVGGLVGDFADGTITDSDSQDSTVTAKGTGGDSLVEDVGGLVGDFENGIITNSYSNAEVTAIAYEVDNVGGLVGYFEDGTIAISDSNAEVTATGYYVYDVGGLVGSFRNGAITGSYSDAEVTAIGEGEVDAVGGLVGSFRNGAITGSYSDAEVTAIGEDEVGDVGGLVGYFRDGTITDSSSDAEVNVTGDDVHGVGSLVGFSSGEATITTSCSYRNAEVNVTGNRVSCVGGLVGCIVGGTIDNSYSNAEVNVIGDNVYGVGGLVGFFLGGTIANSYSSGQVNATGAVVGDVGGLVGFRSGGTVTNSYWDMQTSGQLTSPAGDGKTTAAMQNIGTFVAWDIVLYEDFEADWATWFIKHGEDYPRLWWQWWQYVPEQPAPEPECKREEAVAGFGFAFPERERVMPDLPVARVLSVITGDNAYITPAFIFNGSWSELVAATSAYRRTLQQYEAEQEGLSPALIALYEVELAIAWAAILAREAGLAAENNEPYDLAALRAAYRAAAAILSANRNLLTTAQATAAELLMEAIAEVIENLGG